MNDQPVYFDQPANGEFFRKVILTVLFVLFLNLFFFRPFGPAAFVLFALGTFLFGLSIFYRSAVSPKFVITTLGSLLILMLSSFIILVNANGFIVSLSGLLATGVLLVFFYLLITHIPFVRSLLELLLIPIFLAGSYLKSLFKNVPNTFQKVSSSSQGLGKKQKYITSTILGFCIGFPIVIILIALFSKADPIYSSFVSRLFNAEFLHDIFWRIILSVIFFILFIALACIARKKEFYSPLGFLLKHTFLHEMTIVMSLVGLVLASFLIVQWPYVFANVPIETHLSQFGVATYSEYVKRGFRELLIVSFFLYVILWFGLIFLRNKKENQKSILPFMQLVVIGEFLIFIFSIFRRIWLYQQYHGWSLIRIYGGFFLIWVTVIALFLAARHFWQKKFVIAEALFTGFIILCVGFFNAEEFIVLNHPPTVNNRVDYTYLARMSPDGYAGWQQAFSYADTILSQKGLEQEGIIERDDRGQVKYAGIITRILTRHYYALLVEYGSDDEIKTYYKDILRFQTQQFQATLKSLERQRQKNIEALISKGMDANRPMQDDYDIGFVKEKIQRTQEIIEKIDKNYKTKEDIIAHIAIGINNDTSYGTFRFLTFYDIYDYNVNKYNVNKKILPKDFLSFLYEWNYSKQQAYLKMKADIPYQNLLVLQKKYFQLQDKIDNQPENQQDISNDISFETPFLEPL